MCSYLCIRRSVRCISYGVTPVTLLFQYSPALQGHKPWFYIKSLFERCGHVPEYRNVERNGTERSIFAMRVNENTHGKCGRRQLGRYGDSLGLDGPEIESRWERDFSPPIQSGPGFHLASCKVGTGSFPGVKLPGLGVDYPLQSSAEVNEAVPQLSLST